MDSYIFVYKNNNTLRIYSIFNAKNQWENFIDENKLYNTIFSTLSTNSFIDDEMFQLFEFKDSILTKIPFQCICPQIKEIYLAAKGIMAFIKPIIFKNENLFLSEILKQPIQLCNAEQITQLKKISKQIVDCGQIVHFNLDFPQNISFEDNSANVAYKYVILHNYKVIGFFEKNIDNLIQCYIIPEYRKNGIAEFIISEFLSGGNSSGRTSASKEYKAYAISTNIAAIQLLAKLHFMQTEEKKKINGVHYTIYKREVTHSILPIIELPNFTISPKAITWNKNLADNFPYRRYYMPPFIEMYQNLKEFKHHNKTIESIYKIDRTFPEDYENADSIVDHFVEELRIQCAERNESSPYAIWQRDKHAFMAKSTDVGKLREMVYHGARGCNVFNVALGIHLFTHFKATSLLDCTAGWGDRLIAAAMAGVKFYRGWDTNNKLQPIYNNIYNTIAKIENGDDAGDDAGDDVANSENIRFQMDWRIFCAPFEKSKLFHKDSYEGQNYYKKFDVAFLSPPFYDKELYEGDVTSTTSYKNINEWYAHFYRPMFKRAALAVKHGGHILAYIPDGRMRKEANAVLIENGFKYIDSVAFRTIVDGRPPQIRDTFVWAAAATEHSAAAEHSTATEHASAATEHAAAATYAKLDMLPHKKISSVKFKLGQKFNTNNNESIHSEEKFNKLLLENPDLKIMEIPQNIQKTVKINILIYTININSVHIIKYYILKEYKLEFNSHIDKIIKTIESKNSENENFLQNRTMAEIRCIFAYDAENIIWITSIDENTSYVCPIHTQMILNTIKPYKIIHNVPFYETIKLDAIIGEDMSFVILKGTKSIGAIQIEKNIYGIELSILLKSKYKIKEVIYPILIMIYEYIHYTYNNELMSGELAYIEIEDEKIVKICKKIGFKDITTFGHTKSAVFKI